MEWNYQSKTECSTGYEDVMGLLKEWNKEKFVVLSPVTQSDIVDSIFNIYRDKNIFPIQYYNEHGIINEINKCLDKDVNFDGDVLNLKYNQGSSVCRFLFPNLSLVECKGVKNNSPYEKFMDDYKLKKAIDFCLRYKSSPSPVTPSGIKDGLEMMGGNVATNFKPMNAKALYEKYTPKGGVIYDFSCGFGGRMLGALSSKNNYRYMGVEPNTETFDNLNKLGGYIEKATNRSNIFKIYHKGSEDIRFNRSEFVDFAFSSPPYFSLERYSDEETQCYIKFPTLDEWFEGYVKPTIKTIYDVLKPNRYYAVNISDFKIGKETVKFVEKWIELSIKAGFVYDNQIFMKLQTRRGEGHDESNLRTKEEGIFVFKKEK
jgi:hypothetical protein